MSRLAQRIVAPLMMACSYLPATVAVADVVTPESLIRDMSEAIATLNYEGSFVHVQNGNVEAMSIVHSSDGGGELEYMLSLNGEAREVFRNRSLVTCIWPSSQSVIISDSKQRQLLPNVDESLTSSELYQLSMGKPDRVAGKAALVVEVKPKDNYRYGYRFWIDQETKMLLRSMLLDSDNNAVEQVMFTNINYPHEIAAGRFETPDDEIDSFKTQKPVKGAAPDVRNRVDFSALPHGYKEISETYQPMPINDGSVSHVMLSDGMASVSVYVEYVEKSKQADVPMGVSSMGAMNAYTLSLDSALITVVGEVPAATVESIALAVRLVE